MSKVGDVLGYSEGSHRGIVRAALDAATAGDK